MFEKWEGVITEIHMKGRLTEIAIRPVVPKAAWPISGYVSSSGSLSKQERKSSPV